MRARSFLSCGLPAGDVPLSKGLRLNSGAICCLRTCCGVWYVDSEDGVLATGGGGGRRCGLLTAGPYGSSLDVEQPMVRAFETRSMSHQVDLVSAV